MKPVRVLLAAFSALGIGLITFKSGPMLDMGLTNLGLGWMASYLLPRMSVLVLTILLALLLWPATKALKFRILLTILVLGIGIGGYLIVNPPYIRWTKQGTDMTAEVGGHPIEAYLNEHHPGFDGVICLALPGCPHCKTAIPKLALMQQRVPDIDLFVFVFTEDSAKVTSFKQYAGVDHLPYVAVPEPKQSIRLSRGRFPAFLYFKDGKVVYRWSNNQFGYPAFDWVEAGFK